MAKIAAVTVGFPGVLRWLENYKEEGLLDLVVLDGSGKTDIPEADVVLLGAWHPAYQELGLYLRSRDPAPRLYVGWTSSPLEMETPTVPDKLNPLRQVRTDAELRAVAGFVKEAERKPEERSIDGVACLHPGMVGLFPAGFGFHLPAAVHVPENAPYVAPGERRGIGGFSPDGSKKNIISQIIAVRALQKAGFEEPLITNWARYEPILRDWGLKYEIAPWEPDRGKHLERLARCRLVLSASVGESWCYGAIDSVTVGVPVVGSRTIPWLPEPWMVTDPNDPREIAACARRLLDQADVVPVGDGVDPRVWVRGLAERQNAKARTAFAQLALGKLPE